MKDNCNRVIDYIRISITDRCNLRCQYCMPEEGITCMKHEEVLSYEEIIKIITLLSGLGIQKVRITGGEPLVRKNVSYLIKEIKKIPDIKHISLTTNAILLPNQLEALVLAGLDSINISLDTLHPESFKRTTRGGDVTKVIEAITLAKQFKNLTIKINCVPYFQTKNEIIEMIDFSNRYQIPLRFIELMPIGLGRKYTGISQEELLEIIKDTYGNVNTYNEKIGNGPAHYVQIQSTKQIIGFISALSHIFCSSCNRVRLTADGYLKACLQYQDGMNIKKKLRAGIKDTIIKQQMEKVIYYKPKEHHFLGKDTSTDEIRSMHEIGG